MYFEATSELDHVHSRLSMILTWNYVFQDFRLIRQCFTVMSGCGTDKSINASIVVRTKLITVPILIVTEISQVAEFRL